MKKNINIELINKINDLINYKIENISNIKKNIKPCKTPPNTPIITRIITPVLK